MQTVTVTLVFLCQVFLDIDPGTSPNQGHTVIPYASSREEYA
jgi:hypothetical protein